MWLWVYNHKNSSWTERQLFETQWKIKMYVCQINWELRKYYAKKSHGINLFNIPLPNIISSQKAKYEILGIYIWQYIVIHLKEVLLTILLLSQSCYIIIQIKKESLYKKLIKKI